MCGRDKASRLTSGASLAQNQPLTPARIRQGDNSVTVMWISRHCDPLGYRKRNHLTGDFGEPFGASSDGDEPLAVEMHDIPRIMPALLGRR